MTPAARHHLALTLLLLVLTAVATVTGRAMAGIEEQGGGHDVVGDRNAGEELFQRDCAVCHGPQGSGTDNGPSIVAEGTASIDFQMRTRRMPLPTPDTEVERGVAGRRDGTPVSYTEQELADVVAYAEEWSTGPSVPELPEVVGDARDPALGGELWRRHCAVCHQLAGRGGALLTDVEIPSVLRASELELVEAVRAGPGSMPAYATSTIDEEEAVHLAQYVTDELQQAESPGGWSAGTLGPFAEGAVVWVFGVLVVLLGMAWIGRLT